MADTMGHSASTTRNSSVALSVLVLALTPQIFELLWSFRTIFGFGVGRGPGQVLLAHGTALLSGAPGALFGSFGADAKKAFSSDALLALIYSYPLFAVAILTMFIKVRTAQDYIGGVALIALCAVRAVGLERPAGHARIFLRRRNRAADVRGADAGARRRHRAGRARRRGTRTFALCLARPVIRLGGDSVLCAGDPAARLIVTAFASFMIAALGTHETRWIEAVIVGAVPHGGLRDPSPHPGASDADAPAFPGPVRA